MSGDLFNDINLKLKEAILAAREQRQVDESSFISHIPENLRFLASAEKYHINELIVLCKDDYRDLLVALLTKSNREQIRGYRFIDCFRSHPLIFLSLLAYHPQTKVTVLGKTRFIAVKILMKNPTLFNFIRNIYRTYKR